MAWKILPLLPLLTLLLAVGAAGALAATQPYYFKFSPWQYSYNYQWNWNNYYQQPPALIIKMRQVPDKTVAPKMH